MGAVALIYGLPLLGGIIADRYLGMKKAITFGAILLVLGPWHSIVQARKISMV